jgi:hypothetical protein
MGMPTPKVRRKIKASVTQSTDDASGIAAVSSGDPPAWEMIEEGRFQPRRIRGSCRGRALG